MISSLYENDKALFNLDPRTKIALTLTVSTILITGGVSGYMSYVRLFLATLSMLMLLSIKKYKIFISFSITFLVLHCIEIFIIPQTASMINFILNTIVGIYNHMLPGFIMGYYTIASTKVSEFIASMERIKLPKSLIIPMSVIFRLFPTMKEEYHAINNAMKMRGITLSHGLLKIIEYKIVPFIICTVKIGEELTAAAMTRGLDYPIKRTNICKIGFSILDYIFFFSMIFCWIIFILEG